MRIAVIDDWQGIAETSADWSWLRDHGDPVFFNRAFASEDEAASQLVDFDIILAMRERTAFPASLVERLPRLRMFSLTGKRGATLDLDAMARRGITVCYTEGSGDGAGTAELALALMLAAARNVVGGDTAVRSGAFQQGVLPGMELSGRTLGLIGLGRLGSRMARYGAALGMDCVAWSPNLDAARAAASGAAYVEKDELLARSDVVSLHIVLSQSTRGLIGQRELALMKDGAILVNTSRGPLVDEAALIAALRRGRLTAALDVYDREPLPQGHPLTTLPNTVLTPHLGYATREVMGEFYKQLAENARAFIEGNPVRVLS